MYYIGFKVGVFYKNEEWVQKWFEKLIEYLDDNNCQYTLRKSRYQPFVVTLSDGTCIFSCRAAESSRGQALDRAYLQPGIDKDIVDNVIKPTVKTSRIIIEDLY